MVCLLRKCYLACNHTQVNSHERKEVRGVINDCCLFNYWESCTAIIISTRVHHFCILANLKKILGTTPFLVVSIWWRWCLTLQAIFWRFSVLDTENVFINLVITIIESTKLMGLIYIYFTHPEVAIPQILQMHLAFQSASTST